MRLLKNLPFGRVQDIFRAVVLSAYKAIGMATPAPTEDHLVEEGKAKVFTPSSVFYNPVQEFNRDLTIAVISEHIKDHFTKLREKEAKRAKNAANANKNGSVDASEAQEETKCEPDAGGEFQTPTEPGQCHDNGVRILEALAASGLRSVRFALEIPGVKEIVTNDYDKRAVEFIKKNIEHNSVGHIVTPSHADASLLMYQNRRYKDRFDVIDLDPYGSPTAFIDSAVQAVKDGGLLCITCTDMAILCGNAPEAARSKYGAMPLKAKYCHEMALRIVLQSLDAQANRYSRYIVPVLSLSIDFYVRVFVRVYTSQREVKNSVLKNSLLYNCVGCGAYTLQPLATRTDTGGPEYKYMPAMGPSIDPLCKHCGSRHRMGGPIWSAPIHDMDFVSRVLESVETDPDRFRTVDRIRGMLTVVKEELPDVPLYYVSDDLARVIHCNALKFLDIRSALLHAGYRVSLSHANKGSVKTDAPAGVIWDIHRCWVHDFPVREDRVKPGSPGHTILATPPTLQADFTIHPDANPRSRQRGLLRWQANPERDWGPKPRAGEGDLGSLDQRRQRGEQKARAKRSKRKEAATFKQFPCKRNKLGECDMGENCKYSHDTQTCPSDHVTMETNDCVAMETQEPQAT